jgi:hypothetical protein
MRSTRSHGAITTKVSTVSLKKLCNVWLSLPKGVKVRSNFVMKPYATLLSSIRIWACIKKLNSTLLRSVSLNTRSRFLKSFPTSTSTNLVMNWRPLRSLCSWKKLQTRSEAPKYHSKLIDCHERSQNQVSALKEMTNFLSTYEPGQIGITSTQTLKRVSMPIAVLKCMHALSRPVTMKNRRSMKKSISRRHNASPFLRWVSTTNTSNVSPQASKRIQPSYALC